MIKSVTVSALEGKEVHYPWGTEFYDREGRLRRWEGHVAKRDEKGRLLLGRRYVAHYDERGELQDPDPATPAIQWEDGDFQRWNNGKQESPDPDTQPGRRVNGRLEFTRDGVEQSAPEGAK